MIIRKLNIVKVKLEEHDVECEAWKEIETKYVGDLESNSEVVIYQSTLKGNEDRAYFKYKGDIKPKEKWFQLLSAKDKEEFVWNFSYFINLYDVLGGR